MEIPETSWVQAYFCGNFHRLSAFVEIYQVGNNAILRKIQTPKKLSVEGFRLLSRLETAYNTHIISIFKQLKEIILVIG